MKGYAALLLALGLLQMVGDVTGTRALVGIGRASVASPAPRVFSAVRGLETYSTRFFLTWTDEAGSPRELELTPRTCALLRGPYNRRNVYGAALAYGPVLASDGTGRALLEPVLTYALTGDAPLLRELGIDPEEVSDVAVRYEPLPGTDLGTLPTRIVPPARAETSERP